VPEPWTTEREKVLVVSDDQDAGELLARLLDRAGWTTDLGEAWITGGDGCVVRPFEADDFVAEVAATGARPDGERDAHRRHQVGLLFPDTPT
jgi:hypothetical protein